MRLLLSANMNVFSAVPVSLSTALAVSTWSGMWFFSFSPVLRVFLLFLRLLLWPTGGLEVRCSFQEFGDFPVSFLSLISVTPGRSEDVPWMVSAPVNLLGFVL